MYEVKKNKEKINRRICVDNNLKTQRKINLKYIIQRCDYHTLYNLAKENNYRDFEALFRKLKPGNHEIYSCKSTFQKVQKCNSYKDALPILVISDNLRYPTCFTGANITDASGQVYMIQHPTSSTTNYFEMPLTSKGNVSSKGSTSMHHKIYKASKERSNFQEELSTSVSMNTNAFIQAPKARNANTDVANHMESSDYIKREALKFYTNGLDVHNVQNCDADWIPDLHRRSPSPIRLYHGVPSKGSTAIDIENRIINKYGKRLSFFDPGGIEIIKKNIANNSYTDIKQFWDALFNYIDCYRHSDNNAINDLAEFYKSKIEKEKLKYSRSWFEELELLYQKNLELINSVQLYQSD